MTKKKDIEKFLNKQGWWQIGGTKHDKWTNGSEITMVPRHKEVNDNTARGIMRLAEANPGKKKKRKEK